MKQEWKAAGWCFNHGYDKRNLADSMKKKAEKLKAKGGEERDGGEGGH